MRLHLLHAAVAAGSLLFSASALAECIGDGAYRVCTETYTDSRGNATIRSYDTQGNSYSVNTESYTSPSGANTIRSYDSTGNSYTVKSWSDSTGVHTIDSMGNRCTITKSGRMIGCK